MAAVVSFDGVNKTITITDVGDINITVAEIYSRWKDWVFDNPQYEPAFRYVGGDPTVGLDTLGITYFIINGWKFKPYEGNHVLDIVGNLYQDGGGNPYLTTSGYTIVIRQNVSNIVEIKSVTTESNEKIEYLGSIFLDETSIYSSAVYPNGTISNPINNLSGAITLANYYGFNTIKVLSNFGLSGVSNTTISNLNFIGQKPNIILTDYNNIIFNNVLFDNFIIDADFVGSTIVIDNSIILNALNINGHIKNTQIKGVVKIDEELIILNSYSTRLNSVTISPILNMNATNTTTLQVKNHSGNLDIINCDTVDSFANIELISGNIKLDSTCTDGTIILKGNATFENNAGVNVVLNKRGLLIPEMVDDIHLIHGLDDANPMVVSRTSRTAGNITQSMSNVADTVTVTRL
jgi:hypothetical protein